MKASFRFSRIANVIIKPMADVIIVPGRSIYPDGTLYSDPKSRIQKAAQLYNEGAVHKIIMSGGFSFHFKNTTDVNEAKSMKQYAVELGVAPGDILTENQSTHTLANALFCKKVFCEPNNWKNIIVIASSDHMPRVVYVFNKVFGPQYNLTYQKSARVIGVFKYVKELVHEIGSMHLTKKWLDTIKDGDDTAIRSILLQNRPNDTVASL